jgi:hypothetical protein
MLERTNLPATVRGSPPDDSRASYLFARLGHPRPEKQFGCVMWFIRAAGGPSYQYQIGRILGTENGGRT